jgi:predicted O-methyltransferase YrrM
LAHHLGGADERFLAAVTDRHVETMRHFLDEPADDAQFQTHLLACVPSLRETPDPIAYLYSKKVLLQYALVRALAPAVIVETGVANGISSSYLLLACHLNRKGIVYSIDTNDREFLPPGKATGWIVPDYLSARWTLILTDARKVLPPLLLRLGQIDVFIHDSAHTYDQMQFEFEQSYSRLRPKGLLLSDDVSFNSAFDDFVAASHPALTCVIDDVGVMTKRRHERYTSSPDLGVNSTAGK